MVLNKYLLLIFTLINTALMAQSKKDKEILKKIELDSFSNSMALDMGLRIVELAKTREQHDAVEISRLNHTVFLYIDDNLTIDKHNWLR